MEAVRELPVASPARAPSRGRNHRAGATEAILAATQELLESQQLRDVTVDAIADRAGVSLPTIYRRWPTKAALIKAALLSVLETQVPLPNSGRLRDDLLQVIEESRQFLSTPLGMAFVRVAGAAAHDAEWREFGSQLHEHRRVAMRAVLGRAVERGEISADVDQDILLDLFQGHVWMSLFFRHTLPDRDACARAVNLILDGTLRENPDLVRWR